MSETLVLHPANPDPRLLEIIVKSLKAGAVIAYPTDSGYALGCKMGLSQPLARIRKIRNLDEHHNFTLICRDLSEIARYAKVDNAVHRLLKRHTPGGYTFILQASRSVPSLLLTKRTTIGIRVPEHHIPIAISEALGEPLVSSTLILPDKMTPLVYPEEVAEALSQDIELIIDGGYCGFEATSIVDLSDSIPRVLRVGSGDTRDFE